MDDLERLNQRLEEDDLLRRLEEADPEAWASAEVPLLLLGGDLPLSWLWLAAESCLKPGYSPTPGLRHLIETWWQNDDADSMVRLLGQLARQAGQGSDAHRRCVLALTLCSRAVGSLAGEQQPAVLGCLQALENWAWGVAGIELEKVLQQARVAHEAARQLWQEMYVSELLNKSVDAADEASALALCAAKVAIEVGEGSNVSVSVTHEGMLAMLIRSAIPICPLMMTLPSDALPREQP